jgi:hypothetical protein
MAGPVMATESERLTEQLDNIWQLMERARQAYENAAELAAKLPDDLIRVSLSYNLGLTELAVGADQRLVDLHRREVSSC